ncbi:MAG: cyclic nucleotide-binding domain-containing protein [Verrucomicrobiota bacterium JB022]|nr:cyclic nucleotide-binding domain-containing protein [Verrucomicrobiota bacterium JB022]
MTAIAEPVAKPAPGKDAPPSLDQKAYVLDTPLELTSFMEMHQVGDDLIVFKNRKSKTYLTVNRTLAKIILSFRKPTRLKDLFPILIEDRLCPRLDDLYELILQARKAYILLGPDEEEPAFPIVNWRGALRSEMATVVSLACIVVGLGCWLFQSQHEDLSIFKPNVISLAAGYLGMCLAISIGFIFGASLANWQEREIYRARFNVASLFPHFHVDLRDLQTAGTRVETESALVQIAPLFLLLGGVSLAYPSAACVVMVFTLLQMLPVKGSAIRILLRSRFARKELSVHEHQDFVGNQTWKRSVYNFKQNLSISYLFAAFGYCLVWLALAGGVLYMTYEITGATFLDFFFAGRDLQRTAILAGILTFAAGTITALGIVMEAYFKAKTREKSLAARPRKVQTGPQPHEVALQQLAEQIRDGAAELELELLHETTLFNQTSLLGLHRLQGSLGFERFQKGDVIFDGEGLIDRALYICSGEVEIVKRYQTGRKVPVPNQGPNTIIDQISIMYGTEGHTTVRALTPVTCVSFMLEDFKKRIMPVLGWNHLERMLIRETYLKRLSLTQNLEQGTLDYLAGQAKIVQYKQNETVIKEGGDNFYFYILLQGRFDVFKGRRRVGKLSYGEFFGELGILLNSLPTASVVSIEGCICLLIHKSAILQAMGQDYEFAMVVEQEASKRLGKPVFPLKGSRFTNIGGLGRAT